MQISPVFNTIVFKFPCYSNRPWDFLGSLTAPFRGYQSAVQLCSTLSLTLLLYSRLFSLYILAASELAGEFGFGSHSNDCIGKAMVKIKNSKKREHTGKRKKKTLSATMYISSIGKQQRFMFCVISTN